MKRRFRAPSPAVVISLIALFVALCGTTYAATSLPKNSVGTQQLRNGAVTKKKINKTTIRTLKGNRGPQGATGPAGSAVAYAHVLSSGKLDAAHSKNVTLASRVATGIYCLQIAVSVSNATATVDTGNSGGKLGAASAVLSGQDPKNHIGTLCPGGDNAIVAVENDAGANANYSTWSAFN